jgi:hypothetical protein
MPDLVANLGEQRSDLGIHAMVDAHWNTPATGFVHQTRRGVDRQLARAGGAAGHVHRRPTLAERDRGPTPDATARAGDHRHPARHGRHAETAGVNSMSSFVRPRSMKLGK